MCVCVCMSVYVCERFYRSKKMSYLTIHLKSSRFSQCSTTGVTKVICVIMFVG